jgi:hypothetical protein
MTAETTNLKNKHHASPANDSQQMGRDTAEHEIKSISDDKRLAQWGRSPSCEDSRFAGQGILCLLWNTKVHYRVYNSPLLDAVLNQLNPDHTPSL